MEEELDGCVLSSNCDLTWRRYQGGKLNALSSGRDDMLGGVSEVSNGECR